MVEESKEPPPTEEGPTATTVFERAVATLFCVPTPLVTTTTTNVVRQDILAPLSAAQIEAIVAARQRAVRCSHGERLLFDILEEEPFLSEEEEQRQQWFVEIRKDLEAFSRGDESLFFAALAEDDVFVEGADSAVVAEALWLLSHTTVDFSPRAALATLASGDDVRDLPTSWRRRLDAARFECVKRAFVLCEDPHWRSRLTRGLDTVPRRALVALAKCGAPSLVASTARRVLSVTSAVKDALSSSPQKNLFVGEEEKDGDSWTALSTLRCLGPVLQYAPDAVDALFETAHAVLDSYDTFSEEEERILCLDRHVSQLATTMLGLAHREALHEPEHSLRFLERLFRLVRRWSALDVDAFLSAGPDRENVLHDWVFASLAPRPRPRCLYRNDLDLPCAAVRCVPVSAGDVLTRLGFLRLDRMVATCAVYGRGPSTDDVVITDVRIVLDARDLVDRGWIVAGPRLPGTRQGGSFSFSSSSSSSDNAPTLLYERSSSSSKAPAHHHKGGAVTLRDVLRLLERYGYA